MFALSIALFWWQSISNMQKAEAYSSSYTFILHDSSILYHDSSNDAAAAAQICITIQTLNSVSRFKHRPDLCLGNDEIHTKHSFGTISNPKARFLGPIQFEGTILLQFQNQCEIIMKSVDFGSILMCALLCA